MKSNNKDLFGILLWIGFVFFLFLGAIELYSILVLGNNVSKDRAAFIGFSLVLLAAAAALPKSKVRNTIRYLMFLFMAVEGSLQLLAFVGLLPGMDMTSRTSYARVYTTSEGFANSMTNRYGWYAPDFKFRNGAKRIAVVGDSFVDGRQVSRERTLAVRLQSFLETAHPGKYDVIGLGWTGAGPAQYNEFVRYAHDYFDINEVVLMVFVGNDFKNLLRHRDRPHIRQNLRNKGYYDLDENGELVLTSTDRARLNTWRSRMERNHERLILRLPRLIRSHLFTLGVAKYLAQPRKAPGSPPPLPASNLHIIEQIDTQLKHSGLDGFVFKDPVTVDAEVAFTIADRIFTEIKNYCEENHIVLRVVSIPHAPNAWFDYVAANGIITWRIKSWHFAQPELRMRDIFAKLQVPYLETVEKFQEAGIESDTIKSMRFNGTGHFTAVGHDFYAKLISDYFYR